MRPNPRMLYVHLLVATAVGLLAGIPLVCIFPPTDLEAEHAAAVTPFARAVTSHAVDIASALLTCISGAWLLAGALFLLRWRGPRRDLMPTLAEALPVFILLQVGGYGVLDLHKLASGGALRWIAFFFSVLCVLLGLALFASNLASISTPPEPQRK